MRTSAWASAALLSGAALLVACSDDGGPGDGDGMGGSAMTMAGAAGSGDAMAGDAGMGGGATAGSAGMAGMGMGGGDMGEPDAGAGQVDAGPEVAQISFATELYPTMFGVGRCSAEGASCHGDNDFLSAYGSSDVDTAYQAVSGNAVGVLGRVDGGGMPQDCGEENRPDCFTPEEVELLQDWIDLGTPE